MKSTFKALSYIFIGLGLVSLIISLSVFLLDENNFRVGEQFDIEKASQFGGFIAGLVGVFFMGTGTFLVFLTFEQQSA